MIGNPLIVMIIMGYMGYRRRTGFLAGLTVAQISEFSLILGALGLSLGHIDPGIMGLITLVGLVTIGLSTYLILYSGPLYRMLSGPLKWFERKVPFREAESDSAVPPQITDFIIIGLGNFGGRIARRLAEQGLRIFGADFDPEVVSAGCDQCLPVFYGDMGDPELLEHLPLDQARWVVSTIRDRDLNLNLLRTIQERKFRGRVALTSRWEEEAEALIRAGADLVLRPYADAAEQAVEILEKGEPDQGTTPAFPKGEHTAIL